ncbi:MAG: type VI secretion system-associated FHA domain protein [Cellvibrionaceae bacterium]
MEIQLKPIQKPRNNATLLDSGVSFRNRETLIIGRESNCDLTLDCDEKIISRQHARITKIGETFTLTDTSANGTYLNNQSQPLGNGNSVDIHNNDLIRLGDYILKVTLNSENKKTSTKPPRKMANSDATTRLTNSEPKQKVSDKPLVSNSYREPKTKRPQETLGSINENFLPPNVAIPENWDTSLSPQKKKSKHHVPEKLKKSLNFSDQEAVLLKSLLKGLGMSKEDVDANLNADNMLALGRCVRASIAGMIKQRDQSDKIKSKLCFDDNSMLKALNYSSFAEFKTAEEFLLTLLSSEQKTHSEFPLEVMKCQKELMEDQAAIYKSYNKAIDSFREELSPFTIETLYQEKQKNGTNIAEKLVPSIGKWDTYKKQWSEKCLNFKKIIKKNFEDNIKVLHQKRINERQIINKNKK